MQFRLLGPVEVEDQGRLLPLGSAKQRALLAILLLHANEVVSRDRLIDDLWGERPPPSAPHSLDVYVSRLRKTLQANGGEQILVTRPGGYLLRLEPEQLDLARFERLAKDGQGALAGGDCVAAAERFRQALAFWRGEALGDLAYESFAKPEVERLEEQRLATLEDRIEAELALGRHAGLIGELESLARKNPLRERLHGQLMLALYRCGRQAEALEAYQVLRRHLRTELGLDPTPALQTLEQAILRHDPALEPAVEAPETDDGRPAPGSPPASRPPARLRSFEAWRPALPVVVVGGLLVAGAAAAIVLLTAGPGHALDGVDGNAVGIIDPKSGTIKSEAVFGGTPTQIASGGGAAWLSSNNQTVSRIDSQTGTLVESVDVGSGPSGIAYSRAARAVWVANSLDGTVSRIDQASNRLVDAPWVGNVPVAVAAGFGSIWVTNAGDRSVTRLDAKTVASLRRSPPETSVVASL
jgi:DNA-binding SARP family transcriptional activator